MTRKHQYNNVILGHELTSAPLGINYQETSYHGKDSVSQIDGASCKGKPLFYQHYIEAIAFPVTSVLISKRKIEYQLYKILEERDSAIAQEITQKEFCQGIFSRCAPSLYITSSWRLLTCTKIENNIKMNRICMTIKSLQMCPKCNQAKPS